MPTATDSPAHARRPETRLPGLQVLRGLAALSVVAFHAREEVGTMRQATWVPDLTAGAFGVDLFFVLSGFVMLHASAADFGSVRAVPGFLWRRLRRVAPLYWLATLAYILVAPSDVRHGMSLHDLRVHAWSSLAFLSWVFPGSGGPDPVLPVGWTLCFETLFYACFAAVLPLPRRTGVVILCVLLGSCGVAGALELVDGPFAYLSTSLLTEFPMGLALAWTFGAGGVARRGTRRVAAGLAVAAVLSSTPWIDGWLAWRGLVWGLPAAALVWAAVRGSWRGTASRWLSALGDASYALYLTHYVLFAALEEAFGRVVDLSRVPGGASFAVMVAGAVAVGSLTHRLVEVPVARALRGRWGRPGTGSARRAARWGRP